MRGFLLIAAAIFVDGLQALLSLAFTGLGAAIGLIPVAGAAGGPSGIILGFVINTCLSLTMGAGLLFLLSFEGLFYPGYAFSSLFGEIIPGVDNLPIWTTLVVLSLLKKRGEEKGGIAAIASTAVDTIRSPQQAITSSARMVDGIRSASKVVSLLLLLFIGLQTHAQAVPDPIQYILAPETPGPNEPVLIEAQGVGSFLGNATITWSQNGKIAKTGVGERQYQFTTGALGTRTTVRVDIDSTQGSFSHTWTFSPSLVNMVWEADTTIPPFYRGKALYSAGSDLKVVAYPSIFNSAGARIAASALSYQWFHGDDAVPEQSGLGRNIFTLSGDQLQDHESVNVDVYYGAAKVGRGELTIPVTDPQILLYPQDALRGELFDAAIPSAINLVGAELTVHARPLYFSNAANASGQLSYTWTLNDEEVTGPDSSRGILTLRQAGGGQGSAVLGVSLQNNDSAQFVQSAQTTLQLVFGAQTANTLLNFFGL